MSTISSISWASLCSKWAVVPKPYSPKKFRTILGRVDYIFSALGGKDRKDADRKTVFCLHGGGPREQMLNLSPVGKDEDKSKMKFRALEIPDLKLLVPRRFTDARGSFSETWIDRWFRAEIADVTFVQENQAASARKGTVRGLHFQKPPAAQGKLVRVIRGSVFDVTVDIRLGSPSYRKHVATKLDATEGAQLWVPPGFLHGYCTLEDETEVYYKVTSYYSPSHDAGVLWNDPDLGINWPVEPGSAIFSDKDHRYPRLRDLPDYFDYKG